MLNVIDWFQLCVIGIGQEVVVLDNNEKKFVKEVGFGRIVVALDDNEKKSVKEVEFDWLVVVFEMLESFQSLYS